MRLLPTCLLLAALAGCGDNPPTAPGEGLRITPSARIVAPGTALTVTLRNRSGALLTANLCPIYFQVRIGDTWSDNSRDPVPGISCPAETRLFLPGQVLTRSVPLDTRLQAGEYRIVFQWLFADTDKPLPIEARTSESFIVQ